MATENIKNTRPKQMHYIPNFYLKFFSDENHKIWVYDRKENKYWHQATNKVAKKNNYYIVYNKDGEKNFIIDNYITDVENATKLLYQKINKVKLINTNEKVTLSIFFSLLHARTPEWEYTTNELTDKSMKSLIRKEFNSPEITREIINDMDKNENRKSTIDPEEFYSIINNTDNYTIEYDRHKMIPLMVEIVTAISQCLFKKDWYVSVANPEDEFITSDNPFLLIPTKEQLSNSHIGYGIDTPGVEKFIPLSLNRGISIIDDGRKFTSREVDDSFVTIRNKLIAQDSKRFIFAKSKEVLEKIVQITKIDKWQKGDRVIVN